MHKLPALFGDGRTTLLDDRCRKRRAERGLHQDTGAISSWIRRHAARSSRHFVLCIRWLQQQLLHRLRIGSGHSGRHWMQSDKVRDNEAVPRFSGGGRDVGLSASVCRSDGAGESERSESREKWTAGKRKLCTVWVGEDGTSARNFSKLQFEWIYGARHSTQLLRIHEHHKGQQCGALCWRKSELQQDDNRRKRGVADRAFQRACPCV